MDIPSEKVKPLGHGDALIVVDVQYDFLPGGALGIEGGDAIIPVINALIPLFVERALPVIATRDWHPADHSSFTEYGGPWPRHCQQQTRGAAFSAELALPDNVTVISKAADAAIEAYSAFSGTPLADQLHGLGCQRVFITGLATDFCVFHTVMDALAAGFSVCLLTDAIAAVNLERGDGDKALDRMQQAGARLCTLDQLR